jgi:hypothetical protein
MAKLFRHRSALSIATTNGMLTHLWDIGQAMIRYNGCAGLSQSVSLKVAAEMTRWVPGDHWNQVDQCEGKSAATGFTLTLIQDWFQEAR